MNENALPECDVLLVQRSAVDFYPPFLNQAVLLAEAGLRVRVLDGGDGPPPAGLHSSIELKRPLRGESAAGTLLSRFQSNRTFLAAVKRAQRDGPAVRVCYDSEAAAAFAVLPFSGATVCHFHEHPCVWGEASGLSLAKHAAARQVAGSAAVVTVPDSFRAAALQSEAGIDRLPHVVRNCPRKLDQLPRGRLREELTSLGFANYSLVFYQGSVSDDHYAAEVVRSMVHWPCDSVMVFLGPIQSAMRSGLQAAAAKAGVLHRLILLPPVAYDKLFGYTVDADVALSMIRPVTRNFTWIAGAANKRYEYMACGVPQIANAGPGMDELIVASAAGLCIDPVTPESIGCAVNTLLANSALRRRMGAAARRLHLERFHYESEFAPVLRKIVDICSRRSAHL